MRELFRNIESLLTELEKWAKTLSPFKFGLFITFLCCLLLAFLELLGLVGLTEYPTGLDEDGKKITSTLVLIFGSYFMAYLTRLDE